MDLSALIFVALAVAWAVYLIPKALKHHDDVVRSRSVDRFSHTMRVLARREPVSRRDARLVVTPGRPASTAVVVSKASASAPAMAEPVPAAVVPVPEPVERRGAAAARRRLRVVLMILALNALVIGLAVYGVLAAWTVAIPVSVLVAWLVACRLMVKNERPVRRGVARAPGAAPPVETVDVAEGPVTEEVAAVPDQVPTEAPVEAKRFVDPALWDPVPVTLPTYVGKPAATRRTVRTIDLDDTGVWTSGRSESDSQIAREAEAAEKAARSTRNDGDGSRAVGS
ncbi:MAG: hypothetical protein JWO11_3303 [Nocardioides sp.]|nr:hypothetical protein [Nocardioides sp.]